jgi:16S rRNA processing protein RimM
MSGADPDWVHVGRVVRLRGAKGRLTAGLSGEPSPLAAGQTVQLRRGDQSREHRIAKVEHYRDRAILELEGITSAELAEPLVGSDILLQSKDLVDLPEGTYYIFRLVGLEVRAPGFGVLGKVANVVRTGGADLLLVQGKGDREILIPFVRNICRVVDLDSGFIEIDPPEGLLEIDAI